MKRIFFFIGLISFFYFNLLYGQNGTIRGTIYDNETGEYLPGVTIFAEGTSTGTITDLDGNFSISLTPGKYNLRISFISYETITLENIIVTPGEVTVLNELGLHKANFDISEVTVTAQTIRNTETALISIRKRSSNVLDGISADNLRKIGDSDIASSMKRVTGVSVADGKYVYVRGLGDRYTKTILNGVDIPGLDPDRNTLQMDLFPTDIIDNIIVYKSFSADLPADFTGGVIDLEIKDFPVKKSGSISAGLGYNPLAHFNPEYLTYQGGKLDFLGFDDGTRRIPARDDVPEFALVVGNPQSELGQRYMDILNAFDPVMAAMRKRSFMDYNLGFSLGDQVKHKKVTLGYNVALSYKNNTEFYKNAENGRYGLSSTPSVYEMEVREHQTGDYGVNNTFLSGLAGLALKTDLSKYRLYLMHLQNGESKAGIFDFVGSDQGSNFVSIQHNLDYSQRSLTNMLIDGKHKSRDNRWDVEWKLSPTLSILYDPDVRFTRYEVGDDGSFRIGTEVGFPERIWRNLMELNLAGLAKATRTYEFLGRQSKLNFGAAYTYKYRQYSIRKFLLNVRGGNDILPLTGNPDELLSDDLKWPYEGNLNYGTAFDHDFSASNRYDANVNYVAGFISTEITLLNRLKTSMGLRLEKYVQRYTGQNQQGTRVLDNDKILDDLDLFPSVNIIYTATDNQNIRFSYSRTIARPSMKELSYAEIYDPISGRTFIGGLHVDQDAIRGITYWDGNLVSTNIDNFDIRWERLTPNGHMLSVSGFYKKFKNPIEMVQFTTQTGAFQPRNVGDGKVFGTEIEVRQDLSVLGDLFTPFTILTNFTLANSRIRLSPTEYQSRIENARSGQTIDEYRHMAGQAPYLVNAGLAYNGGKKALWKGFEAGLYYNVQGTTLQFTGIVDRPDIYSLPFHSLNFNSKIRLGKEDKIKIGLKVENILGAKKELVFKSFNAQDQYFSKLNPGILWKISLGYDLF